MTPLLLTEPQAAEALGVPPTWLARKRKAGLVPYRDLGDKRQIIRYSQADLDEIIRLHQVKAARGRAS